MQTREHSATEEMRRPADEKYRVIPASILDSPGRPKPMTAHRFSRYLFGMVVLVALGAMGYFAFTEHLLAGEAGEDSQWERLIAELKGGSGSDGSTLEEGQVQLQIVSRPDGALIEIDDTPIGTTPLMHRLETGAYIISVKKPNYATIDTVVVFVEGGVAELAFSLSESSGIIGGSDAGTLAQGAIPPGVGATSSGATAGSTRDVSQNTGSRPTSPAASGSGSVSSGSTRGSGMPAPNRSTPPVSDASNLPSTESAGGEVGAITISSEPAGASVVIGGRFLGRTPLTSVPVPLGTHDLTFFLEGYETYSESIVVTPGGGTSFHGRLTPVAGELSILVLPWGSIYIDGALHRADTDVRYVASVPSGAHTVRVVHPTLGTITREVQVRPGSTTSLTLDFDAQD